jgi:DUF4097 and DUF4098 domain-containing protein YvlB
MRRILAVLAVTPLVMTLMVADPLIAQDFQRAYSISAGGQIRIATVSGNVAVAGYDGDTILVHGYKEGRDRDQVQIEDTSAGDRVDLRVRYPESCNCDASVRFDVRVPRAVTYNFERISSVSGNVLVEDITGRLKAEAVSGNVDVKDVSGLVSASAVSGNVTVEIRSLEGAGDMKFSAVSGNVTVKAPANLDADIDMSSVSGSLKTDFPIEVQERRYGPGRSARGRLGGGSRNLRISSVSGRVSLTRT